MEIIKNAIRVGNSAGVLLPRKWLNSQVRVVLEPLNIERDILDILTREDMLKGVLGVYLIGSYARKEQTIDSDIDVLVITNNTHKKIKKGRYEIICISEEQLKNQLMKNALPVLPMIKEAKTILNEDLIRKYINYPLSKKNLKWHIETTKSAMKVNREAIKLAKDLEEENVSDAYAYSLILRLRTLYIIDCVKKNKMWGKKDFLQLIKKVSGSLVAYERYLSSKNKNTLDDKLPIKEAEKLMIYINKKVIEVEKWLQGRKD